MIEVMVAILLTAIATSGIIGLYMVETRASGFSRHSTEATVLAQDRMEQLRTTKYLGGPTDELTLNEQGTALPPGIFKRTYSVTNAGTPTYDDMIVTVTWHEDGVDRSVTLRSRRNK